MIIRDMNLSLIISCILIVIVLIILPLIISYKAEKKDKNINEWEKIKKFSEKLNDETRNKN
tara:strand:+ start:428 stop:610 length:183 start_codon:yes stop_codon:yes gene_type:complete